MPPPETNAGEGGRFLFHGQSVVINSRGLRSVSQDIAQGLMPNLGPGEGWRFSVRGITIFDSRLMDGSQKGNWLRTTRAFDAALKDYQEDIKE